MTDGKKPNETESHILNIQPDRLTKERRLKSRLNDERKDSETDSGGDKRRKHFSPNSVDNKR